MDREGIGPVLDNGRISSVQLLLLLFMMEVSTEVIYLPAKIAEAAGSDGWFSVSIPAFCYGLIVVGVVLSLAGRFPSQVLTEYLPEVIGKVPGKLLAAIYAVVLINFTFGALNEGSSFIKTAFMGHTPLMVFDAIGAIVGIYGAYLGVEVIVRHNQLLFPLWMLSLVAVLSLVAKDISFSNLRPVFENGLIPVLKGTYFLSPWLGEISILLMVFPYLNQKQEAFKTALWVLGPLAILAGVTMLVTLGVFGSQVTAHLVFPYDSLARYISVGDFIERMNILLAAVWFSGVVVKLAILYHSSGIAIANVIGLKSYRITLIPIAIATVILSKVVFGDAYSKLTGFLFGIYPPYGALVEVAIPAIILLVAVIRKKDARTPAIAGSAGRTAAITKKRGS
jgi:spore germination protein KB